MQLQGLAAPPSILHRADISAPFSLPTTSRRHCTPKQYKATDLQGLPNRISRDLFLLSFLTPKKPSIRYSDIMAVRAQFENSNE